VQAEDKGDSADQTDSNYYWQGTQLYNLDVWEKRSKVLRRPSSEAEHQRSGSLPASDPQEIVNNAKKRSEEKSALNYGGTLRTRPSTSPMFKKATSR